MTLIIVLMFVAAYLLITTSHFSIHTWPELGYAAVDIFSCSADVPESVAQFLKSAFRASSVRTRMVERIIGTADSLATS